MSSCLYHFSIKGGPSKVAEMSGRRARIARCERTGKLKYELRPEATEETLNIKVT
jgi:hypothetical protein